MNPGDRLRTRSADARPFTHKTANAAAGQARFAGWRQQILHHL
ncbi:hypothetical protein [Paenibacillus favisporus]